MIKRRLLLLSLPEPGYYPREEAVTISPDPRGINNKNLSFSQPQTQGRTIVFFLWPNRAEKVLRDSGAVPGNIDCFVMLHRPAKASREFRWIGFIFFPLSHLILSACMETEDFSLFFINSLSLFFYVILIQLK